MSDGEFRATPALDVRPGDRVRMRSGTVITVSRIEPRFLENDAMICLIEDTDERWRAQPSAPTPRSTCFAPEPLFQNGGRAAQWRAPAGHRRDGRRRFPG